MSNVSLYPLPSTFITLHILPWANENAPDQIKVRGEDVSSAAIDVSDDEFDMCYR
jgi:hypothetical protein